MYPMVAKYRGKCIVCGHAVHVGEQCYWQKAKGVAHHNCWNKELENTAPTMDDVYPVPQGELLDDQGQVCENCGEPLANGEGDEVDPYGHVTCSVACMFALRDGK